MQPSLDIDQLDHTPTQYVKITIDNNGDTERVKVAANPRKARVTAKWYYRPEHALMATESLNTKYGDDRHDVHAAINDALAPLDVGDGVLQTIDRLRRVGHWMDDQGPVLPDDVSVNVHGDYKPLRSGQDMLLVDDDDTYRGQKPFVKIGDDLPPVEDLRDDLDQKVERRVKRGMCGQQRTHYEEEVDGRVRADIMRVDSLEEAEHIVRGDQGENNDHDSD